MPNTTSNSNLRAQIWERQLLYEAMADLWFTKRGLVGSEKNRNGIIIRKDDLMKKKGDQITVGLAMLMTGEGRDGDIELEGHEEELTTYDFSFYINQKRNAVRLSGRMDEQKVVYNMRTDAKNRLKTWMTRIIEREIFRKLAGLTSYTFSNTPTAPSTNRVLYGGSATGQSDIDSDDKFDTTIISKAKVEAETEVSGRPILQKISVDGQEMFVCFVHNYQAYDLFQDSVWLQAQREAGVRGLKNPIFTGALGIWDNVLVHKHPFIPTYSDWGSGGATPGARALFCGAQALCFGFGERTQWSEKSFDYGNKWGISCGGIWGCQKTVFNSEDFGVIALDTYAVDPNA